tara:strand:- start:3693 stop:4043 length:351 start_codon:yes stop_codon:yes gene_type:complete
MKLSQLKSIVKDAVKEAIQEEMKDILMEAVRSPKQTVYENRMSTPSTQSTLPETDKVKLRENMMNVLDGMRPGANGTLNANTSNVPLQVTSTDTMNGSLPQGEVNMDQIMGLMNKR